MADKLFSRDELLSGDLNRRRRAARLLSAIEGRCLYMREESRRVVAAYLIEGDADFQRRFDRNYVQSLKLVAESGETLRLEHLERCAPQWRSLVPPDPDLRASVLRLVEQKYGLGPSSLLALCGAGRDVQEAYRQLFGTSLPDLEPGPSTSPSPLASPAGPPATEPEAWQDFEARLQWLTLAGGEVLLRQGDPSDALYVVISGRLRATVRNSDGSEHVVTEMGRGELVGEMGVLTGDPRAATVHAVRDSEVVRLARGDLLALAQRHLEVMIQINALLARRMRGMSSGRIAKSTLLTLALIPCDAGVPIQDFGRQLLGAIAAFGPAVYVTAAVLDEAIEPGAAQAGPGHPRHAEITGWLSELEGRYRYVVYEGQSEASEWSRRCIRQADRVLLVGRAGAQPAPQAHETALLWSELPLQPGGSATPEPPGVSVSPHTRSDRAELALLHTPETSSARQTALWLAPRTLRAHHHLRLGNAGDMARLVRSLTGHAVGVVLSGGGARGFGHIGALRALQEAGIPVDETAGTSMGALLSAGYALTLDEQALQELVMDVSSRKALLDPTLPLVSFYATRKITNLIRRITGDVEIEDLWLPYFCISANLSKGEQKVHTQGPLWRAVRASMACVPAFTPILDHGELLVDGGYLNNLPVDVMRQRLGNATVLGIDCSPLTPKSREYDFGPSITGWEALRHRFLPSRRRKGPPNMLDIFLQMMDTNGLYRLGIVSDTADLIVRLPTRDCGLLDFDHCADIIDIGYRATCEQLAGWLPQGGKSWK